MGQKGRKKPRKRKIPARALCTLSPSRCVKWYQNGHEHLGKYQKRSCIELSFALGLHDWQMLLFLQDGISNRSNDYILELFDDLINKEK